jgi:hypothetical protein
MRRDVIEVCRMMGSIPLGFLRLAAGTTLNITQSHVQSAFDLAEAILALYPETRLSFSVGDPAWHGTLAPTAYDPTAVTADGYAAEVARFAAGPTTVQGWIDTENTARSMSLAVGAVLYDCEAFANSTYRIAHGYATADPPTWDAALTARHLEAWTGYRSVWSGVPIIPYAKGNATFSAVSPAGQYRAGGLGLIESPYYVYTHDEGVAMPFSPLLYDVADLGMMQARFESTAAVAAGLGIYDLTPYIAFGTGSPRAQGWSLASSGWLWNYPARADHYYDIGARINNRAYHQMEARWGTWNRVSAVGIYPSPFDSRTFSERGIRAFLAYCYGAAGIAAFPSCSVQSQVIWTHSDDDGYLRGVPSGHPGASFRLSDIGSATLRGWWEMGPDWWTLDGTEITAVANRVAGGPALAKGTTGPSIANPDTGRNDGGAGANYTGTEALTCDALASYVGGADKPVSVYVVSCLRDVSALRVAWGASSSSVRYHRLSVSTSAFGYRRADGEAGAATVTRAPASALLGRYAVFADRFDGATRTIGVDGLETSGAQDTGPVTISTVAFGANDAAGAAGIVGSIRAILFFEGGVSTDDDAMIRRYLELIYQGVVQ